MWGTSGADLAAGSSRRASAPGTGRRPRRRRGRFRASTGETVCCPPRSSPVGCAHDDQSEGGEPCSGDQAGRDSGRHVGAADEQAQPEPDPGDHRIPRTPQPPDRKFRRPTHERRGWFDTAASAAHALTEHSNRCTGRDAWRSINSKRWDPSTMWSWSGPMTTPPRARSKRSRRPQGPGSPHRRGGRRAEGQNPAR